ncbi:MAG: DciA family protein [Betaproteobacteria bacterium]
MVRLRQALDGGLKRLGIMRQVRRARAVDIWTEVVGPAAAQASRALSCRDGVLFVAVKSSVWANELSLLKADIIKKLNRQLGRGTIVDIRFQARSLGRDGRSSGNAAGCEASGGSGSSAGALGRRRGSGESAADVLSCAEMKEIDALSAVIADPQVRAAFTRAAVAARVGVRENLGPGERGVS